MSEILRANNVSMVFGGLTAVDSVNLTMNDIEILSLIGPNGAGKTTFFNMLTGVYKPTTGNIIFMGEDITDLKAYQRVEKGISRTFQNIRLFSEMTVLENLLVAHPKCNQENLGKVIFGGRKLKTARREIVEECEQILEVVGLQDKSGELATNLPYGKQRLLEIGRALATNQKLVLLDEPGAGMNTVEKKELSDLIYYMTEKMDKKVLLIEHDMKFVMEISDRIVVLDYGELIADGKPEDIQKNEQVIEAYLGKGNKCTYFLKERKQIRGGK